ncbi:hypothetical protein K1719_023473 [Acacia pycnantha]|nr:hypothetical protein K1719_023473 [Acacia pycnantha]
MGSIYEAMDRAKEKIEEGFKKKPTFYQPVWDKPWYNGKLINIRDVSTILSLQEWDQIFWPTPYCHFMIIISFWHSELIFNCNEPPGRVLTYMRVSVYVVPELMISPSVNFEP